MQRWQAYGRVGLHLESKEMNANSRLDFRDLNGHRYLAVCEVKYVQLTPTQNPYDFIHNFTKAKGWSCDHIR